MVGILGCPDVYDWKYQFEVNEYFVVCYCFNCLYHGIDWIYSTVETVYSYDFRVWYFWFLNSVYGDCYDFF